MATSRRSRKNLDQSTFSWGEPPASPLALPESELAWMTRVATSRLSSLLLLGDCGPDGWSGRTSPASCRTMEEGRLEPFSASWGNSGMGSPTEFLTLSTLEFHSAAVASSLSDVLETGDLPQRYFLSATACKGILRRAAKRGKTLPDHLCHALQQAGDSAGNSNAQEDSSRPSPSMRKVAVGGRMPKVRP